MVAYTPDRQAALADKKVRTSMGKFLRKHLIVVTDAEIARLELQHRAEMDTTFLTAATVDEIERVYINMDGDSGCMRYRRGHFGHVDYHPSAIYASPGMGVAYTQDRHGFVKSRSVVWVNPADPTDKRYVRIYGDPVLKRKLEANGYKMSGLSGAKVMALKDSDWTDAHARNRYVMPYVDVPGGGASGVSTHNADYAVRYKGEDMLTLVDSATRNKLSNLGVSLGEIRTQHGSVIAPTIDVSTFAVTCMLTGETIDRLTQSAYLWINEAGELGWVKSVTGNPYFMYIVNEDDCPTAHYCTPETKLKLGLGAAGYGNYLDDAHSRRHLELVQLDAATYPDLTDDARWSTETRAVATQGTGEDGRYILRADAIYVRGLERDATEHNSNAKARRRSGYVPVPAVRGSKYLYHKDHPDLVTLVSGRRAVKGLHDIGSTHDGQWDYSRNVERFHMLGGEYWRVKGQSAVLSAGAIEQSYRRVIARNLRAFSVPEAQGHVKECLRKGFNNASTFHIGGGVLVQTNYYTKGTFDQIVAAVDWIIANQGTEAAATQLAYNEPTAVLWANAAKHLLNLWDEMRLQHLYGDADANAVDMNEPAQIALIEAERVMQIAARAKVNACWAAECA
jgi:hypothetical protein